MNTSYSLGTKNQGAKHVLPLIVIVGPTASGKTGLAIRLAKEYSGEIISADSRAVYRGLDIGTAKPLREEQRGVPHWGIDLVNPGERFTAADFKEYAMQKIDEIRARRHIPFLVGGTGLYVNAVVYDFQFPGATDNVERRAKLDTMSLDELHNYCKNNNVKLPENRYNKRYVVNSILRNGHALKRRSAPIHNCCVVGISTEKNILRSRIAERAKGIFTSGVVEEGLAAAEAYGWDNEAMTGNIYPLIRRYAAGEIFLSQAQEKYRTLDWRLAKRQLTWLKRDEHIHWLTLEAAYTYLARILASVNK